MMLIPRTIPLILLLSTLGVTSAEAKATLRWKFKEGEVFHYQSSQLTTSKIMDGGKEVVNSITLTIDMTWTVKSVDASGSASLVQKIDRMRTTATLPFGKFEDDSNGAVNPQSPVGPVFKMLVGTEFTTKLSPRGELTDITFPEKLLATLRGGNEPAGAEGQFSEPGLKNFLTQMVFTLPEEPVDTGARWRKKLAIPAGLAGQTRDIDQGYTYTGPDGGKFEAIDLAVTYDPVKPDPNVPVTLKSQETKGRFLFDNAAGRIESTTVTERVELTGKIQGKEIAQANETVTTLTYSKDTPK